MGALHQILCYIYISVHTVVDTQPVLHLDIIEGMRIIGKSSINGE